MAPMPQVSCTAAMSGTQELGAGLEVKRREGDGAELVVGEAHCIGGGSLEARWRIPSLLLCPTHLLSCFASCLTQLKKVGRSHAVEPVSLEKSPTTQVGGEGSGRAQAAQLEELGAGLKQQHLGLHLHGTGKTLILSPHSLVLGTHFLIHIPQGTGGVCPGHKTYSYTSA